MERCCQKYTDVDILLFDGTLLFSIDCPLWCGPVGQHIAAKEGWGIFLLAAGLGFLSMGLNSFVIKHLLILGAVFIYSRVL